jgi:FkbM family methyltransferase
MSLMNLKKKAQKLFKEFRNEDFLVGSSHRLYTDDIRWEIDRLLLPSYLAEIEGPRFKEKYLALIDGLDEASILAVSRIVSRAMQIKIFNGGYLDIYSSEEKETLDFIKYEYLPSFIKLEDQLYSYKKWVFPSEQVSPCAAYYKHFVEELNSLDEIRNKCIIDAGAYIGDSALFLSGYTQNKIFAFEPVLSNYEMLLRTIQLNDLKNVTPLNLGLGARDELINIVSDFSASRYSNASTGVTNTESTHVTTLDDFVQKNGLAVGLIKVDVEGFEKQLLEGAMKTIREQKPSLLLSIYHSGADFFDIKEIIQRLNLGYRFKIRQQFAGSVLPETLLIAEA